MKKCFISLGPVVVVDSLFIVATIFLGFCSLFCCAVLSVLGDTRYTMRSSCCGRESWPHLKIGCVRTRVRKQPIIALYFEFDNLIYRPSQHAVTGHYRPTSEIRWRSVVGQLLHVNWGTLYHSFRIEHNQCGIPRRPH